MPSQPVKRACDSCHHRKVKCDGLALCRNCIAASLDCTYNAVPQKKGPKGSRAKVITSLREMQRKKCLASKVLDRLSGADAQSATPAPALLPEAGLVTGELVKDCLGFFFANMYPQVPILNRSVVEQQALYMEQNPDAYCMLTSLAAFTMLQPGKMLPLSPADPFPIEASPGANMASSMLLVKKRSEFDRVINISSQPKAALPSTRFSRPSSCMHAIMDWKCTPWHGTTFEKRPR